MSVKREAGCELPTELRAAFQLRAGQPGINLEVTLALAKEAVNLSAKLDTGSTDCVFARQAGEQLGLVIINGPRITRMALMEKAEAALVGGSCDGGVCSSASFA